MKAPKEVHILLFFAVAYTSTFIFVWLICSMMAATQAFDIYKRYLTEHKSLTNAKTKQHNNLMRVIAFVFSPLAPALLLGNVATYDERKASLIRKLQADIMQDVEEEIKQEAAGKFKNVNLEQAFFHCFFISPANGFAGFLSLGKNP